MRNFVLAFREIDVSDEIKLRDTFGENGFKFWHRFPNLWLIITPDNIDVDNLSDLMDGQIGKDRDYVAAEFRNSELLASVPASLQSWFEKNHGLQFKDDSSEEVKKPDATP